MEGRCFTATTAIDIHLKTSFPIIVKYMRNKDFFIDKKILYYYKYCEFLRLVEGKVSKSTYMTEKLKRKERKKNK